MDLSDLLSDLWILTLVGLQLAAVILTVTHLVLSNRDVPSTVGWTGLVLLTPLVGVALYWVFGINRIKRKAHRLRPETSIQSEEASVRAEQRAHRLLETRFPALIPLGHLGDELTLSVLEAGNRITPLVNGDEAYPAMLAAIAGAQRSVALSSYIFDNDFAGQLFIAALQRAQQRGVQVRVLVDGVGQWYSRPHTPKVLRRLGIPTGVFLESALPIRNPYVNLRNHRKILVVDGRLGFTGGLNLRAGCLLARNPRHPVQDLHFKVEGPVVRGLMETFGLDWAFTTGERLGCDAWYPVLEPVGDSIARCVPDGPDEDFDVLRRLILGALAHAR
ncbi:MAG: phospholipase D-like domain-containing protein, partial [Halochromatium sp.]